MPKRPRIIVPGLPTHIVQRGHSRKPVFFTRKDYKSYLFWLHQGAQLHGCDVHAYVLMKNHVHILLTPRDLLAIPRLMQFMRRHYVPYSNGKQDQVGFIWERRYKSSLVQEDYYFLTCSRYIELNPVRAGIVNAAEAYPWSSYHHNAQGEKNPILRPHRAYLAIGSNQAARLRAYQTLCCTSPDNAQLASIRGAWRTGTPLGNKLYLEQIQNQVNCSIGYMQAPRSRFVSGETQANSGAGGC